MKLKVNGSEVEVTSEADTPCSGCCEMSFNLSVRNMVAGLPSAARVPFIWTAVRFVRVTPIAPGESRDSDHRGQAGEQGLSARAEGLA
ncbi:MAG: hypothetical protein CM15mP84_05580 [Cellvibrionales bacterium]|nr:MAG: hypothetical protein CM15mP84_05580 [Cellvibrionales bacterium]